jgi:hypothetical protein
MIAAAASAYARDNPPPAGVQPVDLNILGLSGYKRQCKNAKWMPMYRFAWSRATTREIEVASFDIFKKISEVQEKANAENKTVYYGITGFLKPGTILAMVLWPFSIMTAAWELDPDLVAQAIKDEGSILMMDETENIIEHPLYIKGEAATRQEVMRKDIKTVEGARWFATKEGKNLLGYSDQTLIIDPLAFTVVFLVPPEV